MWSSTKYSSHPDGYDRSAFSRSHSPASRTPLRWPARWLFFLRVTAASVNAFQGRQRDHRQGLVAKFFHEGARSRPSSRSRSRRKAECRCTRSGCRSSEAAEAVNPFRLRFSHMAKSRASPTLANTNHTPQSTGHWPGLHEPCFNGDIR